MRSVLILAAALVAGCNAYEPDLADIPFTCDLEERACPEGYVAVDIDSAHCECHREGGVDDSTDENDDPGRPDAGGSSACADDPDNNAPNSATPTAIGTGAATFFTSTTICTGSDVDFYKVELTAERLTLDARLNMDASLGVLRLRILNVAGGELVVGQRTGNQAVATHTASAPGVFLIEVASESGFTDYRLDLAAK